MSDSAKLVQSLHALWNAGDLEKVPSVYSPAFQAHMPKGWKIEVPSGWEGARYLITRIRTAFPDWHEEVQDMICDGNKVVTRYISTGTHLGPLDTFGETGRKIRIDEISIYCVHEGLVAEQWCLTDDLALAYQLGRLN